MNNEKTQYGWVLAVQNLLGERITFYKLFLNREPLMDYINKEVVDMSLKAYEELLEDNEYWLYTSVIESKEYAVRRMAVEKDIVRSLNLLQ